MSKEIKSKLIILASMFVFGTIGIFRNFIPISSYYLAAFRGIIGGLFLLIVILINKKKPFQSLNKRQFIIIAISGVLIGINWVLLFEAYNYASVSISTLCYYMAPIFIIFLSPVFVKEKITLKKIICSIIAIIGMFFVSGILGGENNNSSIIIGVILALCAALIYALVVLTNKRINGVDPYDKTSLQLLSAGIVILPVAIIKEGIDFSIYSPRIVIYILIVGLIYTGLPYLMYFDALRYCSSQSAAIISYIDPATAVILSAIILPEQNTLNFMQIIGAVLIIGAAMISEINLKRKVN